MKKKNNFVIVYSGRSVFVSLDKNNLSESILEVSSSNGGSVTQCTIDKRRLWYRTDGGTDVRVSLADPHKRSDVWDFIDVFVRIERDEESNDSCYYDFLLEFDFQADGFLSITSKLLDGEDQFLLEKKSILYKHYYGENVDFSIEHPHSKDVLYVTIISDINK